MYTIRVLHHAYTSTVMLLIISPCFSYLLDITPSYSRLCLMNFMRTKIQEIIFKTIKI